jgi:hypothetical protein
MLCATGSRRCPRAGREHAQLELYYILGSWGGTLRCSAAECNAHGGPRRGCIVTHVAFRHDVRCALGLDLTEMLR